MRIFVALAAGAAIILASATAAQAQTDSWSGLHVGLQGGYGSRQLKLDSFTEDAANISNLYLPGRGLVVVPGASFAVPAASASRGVWTYGAQLGYDVQLQQMVLGVEGDIIAGSQSVALSYGHTLGMTALTPPSTLTVTRSARASWSWSARARLGFVASDKLLIYATGGITGAQVKLRAQDSFVDPGGIAASNIGGPGCLQPGYNPTNCPGTADFGPSGPTVTGATQSKMQLGWTIGGGGELKLSPHLSLGVEYRYTDYGHKTYSFTNAAVTSQGASITDTQGHTATGGQAFPGDTRVGLSDNRVMLRLNWRFGSL